MNTHETTKGSEATPQDGGLPSTALLCNGDRSITLNKESPIIQNTILFEIEGEEIMRLDKNGMTYKGELINDAGVVYDLMKNYLSRIQKDNLA